MITVYTSEECPKCIALKDWLNKHHIQFDEQPVTAEVITDLRLADIFTLLLPIMQAGSYYYTTEDMFLPVGFLDEGKMRKIFQVSQ